jgi:hypothetical protein
VNAASRPRTRGGTRGNARVREDDLEFVLGLRLNAAKRIEATKSGVPADLGAVGREPGYEPIRLVENFLLVVDGKRPAGRMAGVDRERCDEDGSRGTQMLEELVVDVSGKWLLHEADN